MEVPVPVVDNGLLLDRVLLLATREVLVSVRFVMVSANCWRVVPPLMTEPARFYMAASKWAMKASVSGGEVIVAFWGAVLTSRVVLEMP